MKKPLFILPFYIVLLSVLSINIYAQKGSFIIDDHYRENGHTDGVNFEIISDNNGLISVAHNQGVFQYDGSVWDYYKTPTAAISVTNDEINKLYVGCINGFGKLDWINFQIEYVPIYQSDSIPELFFQTKSLKDRVYFLSEKSLYIYSIDENKILKTIKDKFLNLFVLDENMYVNTTDGTFQIIGTELKKAQLGGIDFNIARAEPYKNKKAWLLLDFDGMLYQFEENTATPLVVNEKLDLLELSITDIQWVNEKLIAASTLDKGCAFIDLNALEIEVLDHSKGLADNEIFAIHSDKEGGVWISHEHGMSRVLASFPARSYSHLPGLSGNLLSVQRIKDRLWLTSSAGIYYFDQDTSYTNKVYYEVRNVTRPTTSVKRDVKKGNSRKRISKKKQESAKKASRDTSEGINKKKKKKKKGVFNRLFKKKKGKLKELEDPNQKTGTKKENQKPGFLKKIISKVDNLLSGDENEQVTDKVSGKLQKDKIYIRKTKKTLKGITHRYSKVQGSEGKCKELIVFKNKLLGISTAGLFEINADSAHLVIDEPIDDAIQLTGTNQLLVLTYDQRIKLFKLEKDIWIEEFVFDPNDIIKDIYQDSKGLIWLAGSSEIFQVEINEEIIVNKEYQIDNHRFDHILMTDIKDTTFFINTQGYYYLDKSIDKLRPYEKWNNKVGKPINYFKDSHNFLWIYNGKAWFEISEIGSMVIHPYFSLFPSLRKITFDQVIDKYWLITGKNQLLAFDHTAEGIDSALHPLFLKKIKAINGVLQSDNNLVINHDNTFLSFEMSKPDYLGLLNTEYIYKLEGMNKKWSEWSKNSKIDFSFLQPGKYTLYVKSRDSFGHIEEATPITFRVNTPYWQTPWFYALQALLFGSLVLLSSKLNQTNRKIGLLKSALTILTLVLIIEFLQSALAAYLNVKSTPVVDFLIDVGTALVVFPVERFLRNVMKGEVNFNRASFRRSETANEETTAT